MPVSSVVTCSRERVSEIQVDDDLVVRRLFVLGWAAVLLILASSALWIPLSKFRFAPSAGVWHAAASLPVIGLSYAALRLTAYRLRVDPSRFASLLRTISERSALVVHAAVFKIMLYTGVVLFSYLSVTVAWPEHDARLAALDQQLGFDWLGFLKWTNSNELVASALVWAYKSSGAQVVALYLFLSITGRRGRLAESFAVMAIAALATLLVNLMVPAAGAYAHYAPARDAFSNFSEAAGMWHYELLMRFRTEAAPVLDLAKIEGLVTFPSFHTVLAILTTYSCRGIKFVYPPVAVLNTVVIVSTLPEGGHHLVDLVAGAVIAAGAIAMARRHGRGARSTNMSERCEGLPSNRRKAVQQEYP